MKWYVITDIRLFLLLYKTFHYCMLIHNEIQRKISNKLFFEEMLAQKQY